MRVLDELVGAVRGGRGGALVLRGEAGIGKSALLEHAQLAASGFRVLHGSGAEFESELPFAALHQLCRPADDHLTTLPIQHQDVLRVAFGLASGPPDPFRVGLATLELLAAAARERPLLCLVDDAQWLDAASAAALAFIARRVNTERLAMLFAVRVPSPARALDQLPALIVEQLSDDDARALLAAKTPALLDHQVRDRIVAEARGNPLALLQLPGVDGFAMAHTSSVPTRIERGFQARLVDLPTEARQLLTLASADPTGDPGLLWPAAQHLRIDVPAASAAATATGLVEFATRVRFCHPLARSAVYLAADADERRRAHQVLAQVTNPTLDPDRQTWHRARASSGPDEHVAAELEHSASRARARGGVVASAAFLERAAELSLDPVKRMARTLTAARAAFDAGTPHAAAGLLDTLENAGLTEPQHAEVDLLRGQIAFLRHGDGDGPAFMIRAGQRLSTVDPRRSRDCFLDALEMSFVVGRPSGVMDKVLDAARASAPAPRPPDILDALTLLTTQGHRAAVPLIRRVLDGADNPLWMRRPVLSAVVAANLWDPHISQAISESLMRAGRDSGAPLALRLGLAQVAFNAALAGDVGRAIEAIAEEGAIADATGGPAAYYGQLQLAAVRGRREEGLALIAEATEAATARGTEQLLATAYWTAAVLNNSLADYPAALAAARLATAHHDLAFTGFVLAELVEAAVRCGKHDTATTALEQLTERADASGTPTGLGIAACARGLVTGVEDHYRDAVEHLDQSPLLPYRARAHLVYGEWLRRQGRRKDGRAHLRTAHELLSGAGIEAFARRAANELRATGENVSNRSTRTHDQLTMQEVHIARFVATGATSNEVAARLFISPRTVDAHLRNIFRKLGITSRRQLRQLPNLVDRALDSGN